ncbi:uncharacterized protein LOC101848133 isoform X2 [Aplysia californica]|uniref:Uncharacterized protein LOC101848133 isoform X2 n=1 Tax=Aplysia californica TaxID=6500 RepID=A0ABM0JXQ6_APLCA|nr:uncharacterized protein LOC101848133 isoform X2 [Aplysia californica]
MSRDLYKARLNETKTSDRRRSRGLERKRNRDDEVNKRRLLSDDMSPVVEDDIDNDATVEKVQKHSKVETRLDRLKKWREERKKKQEEEKKAKAKPVFRVGKMEHKDPGDLFNWGTVAEKPVKQKAPRGGQTESAPKPQARTNTRAAAAASKLVQKEPTVASSKAKAAAVSAGTTGGTLKRSTSTVLPSSRSQRVQTVATQAQPPKASTAAGKKNVRSASKSQGQIFDFAKQIKPDVQKKTEIIPSAATKSKKETSGGKRAVRTRDLSSQLTAAAKAKMNTEKHSGFLRSKGQRMTRSSAQKQVEKQVEPPKTLDAKKELHLSDSAVDSPKHSTPARGKLRKSVSSNCSPVQALNLGSVGSKRRRSQRNEKIRLSRRKSKNVSVMGADSEFEADVNDNAPSFHDSIAAIESGLVADKRESDNVKDCPALDGGSPSAEEGNGEAEDALLRGESANTSCKLNDTLGVLEKSNKENMTYESPKDSSKSKMERRSRYSAVKEVKVAKTPRRKSSRILAAAATADSDIADGILNSESPGKKSNQLDNGDLMEDVEEMYQAQNVSDSDTQVPLEADEDGTPTTQQRERMSSALGKRKSLRLAGLASSSSEMEENDGGAFVWEKKTPRRSSRRQSKRAMGSAVARRKSRRSTVVSVSNEGTTDIEGDDVVESVAVSRPASTPPSTDTHLATPAKSAPRQSVAALRRSVRRSLVVSVSDEGTSVGGGDSSARSADAYHVAKSGHPEVSSRILQELVVEKVDGEISFIEVPMDDSIVGSPSAKESLANSLNGLKDQSTQPFSPRKSADVTASSSSQESSLFSSPLRDRKSPAADPQGGDRGVIKTPRSLGVRGRSLAPTPTTFKEPGEPLSALRARSAKRRKTECSQTPEQMIEILKKSPMVEMSRRRSRHVSSPAASLSNFTALLDEASHAATDKEKANKSAPGLLEEDNMQVENLPLPQDENEPCTQGEPCTQEKPFTQDDEPCTKEEEPSVVAVDEGDAQAAKVKPFRDLLTSETARLNSLCQEWTEVGANTAGVGDDVLGQLRSVVGKAQLLIDQRFKQFSGLVDNCQFNLGEKETTPTDLQGFWEMIYFQVEDVNNLFAELSELKQNGWQSKAPTPVKKALVKRKPLAKGAKAKGKSNFAAFRAEMMKRKAQGASAKPAETVGEDTEATKTFDGGFFAVSSPVQSPSSKSAEGPLKPASPTKTSENQDCEKTEQSPQKDASTPTNPRNKENEASTPPTSQPTVMSVKRLRYTPAVSSPLLNDITDVGETKS